MKAFRVFLYIDINILLNTFQRLSNLSQKTIGLTNFWWAKFFLKIAFIAATLDNILDFFEGAHVAILLIDMLCQVLWVFELYRISDLCSELEEKYANGQKNLNERAVTLIFYRIIIGNWCGYFSVIMLLLSIMSTNPLQGVPLGIALATIPPCMYFISCTPLPPSESKVKMWLKSAKKKMTEAPSPQPDLAPSRC